MYPTNWTSVGEIVLLGFRNLHNFKFPLFSLFLLIYIMTLSENLLIIALVGSSRNLQSPMYFFLQQLSLSDLLGSTNILPILLQTVINEGAVVSLVGCITQMYIFGGSETFECLLLAVMSYDRYVAICNPLRYTSIMSHRVCVGLILLSWLLGFGIILIIVYMVGKLQFCKHNTINHFFCDFTPLLELSCSDTFFLLQIDIIFSIPLVICPFIFIIGSYICIAHEILKIVSSIGRQKAFSTCSSHLAVVSIFFGTLTAIYVVPPRKDSQTISKVLSLLYAVAIPLVNPVIYSLRSKEMKDTLEKCLRK
ncbi:olfactory receptor 11L1-like [Xenopus tropicalis]|uniref:Olfactory receptor n=1 Tax=Xenopus tropicalis TaxID=8364 RepID=A0A8J0QSF6_XENTR|nr:olfactory receptor 11L1-like [Xenopus tropicalis]